jgi:hypothetical protein
MGQSYSFVGTAWVLLKRWTAAAYVLRKDYFTSQGVNTSFPLSKDCTLAFLHSSSKTCTSFLLPDTVENLMTLPS